jgi:uncharacterized protein YjeT (DUF2065 family)
MLPAVVPVLVGPLQTLIALAAALLLAFGGLLFALFTPRGWRLVAAFLASKTALRRLAAVGRQPLDRPGHGGRLASHGPVSSVRRHRPTR